MGHICPEAEDGGPLAYVEHGDPIEIHVPEIRLLVPEEELHKWMEVPPARPDPLAPEMRAAHQRMVSCPNTGGSLVVRRGDSTPASPPLVEGLEMENVR